LKAGRVKKIILFIVIGIALGGVGAYGVLRYVAGQRVDEEIAGFVKETPALEKIDYNNVRVGIIRSSVHLEKIHIKLTEYAQPVIIDEIDLAVPERGDSIPLRARIDIRGFHLGTDHRILGELGTMLQEMGYRKVSGTVTLSYLYDPAAKRLDINKVILQADDMGTLQFDLDVTNLDLPGLIARGGQTDVASLLLALPAVGIGPGRLTYRDDSLVQRITRLDDKRSGQKQLDIWRRSLTRLAQRLEGGKKERSRHAVLILREFIEHPESISVTLDPPKAVPLLRFLWIKKPVDLVELLNMKISI